MYVSSSPRFHLGGQVAPPGRILASGSTLTIDFSSYDRSVWSLLSVVQSKSPCGAAHRALQRDGLDSQWELWIKPQQSPERISRPRPNLLVLILSGGDPCHPQFRIEPRMHLFERKFCFDLAVSTLNDGPSPIAVHPAANVSAVMLASFLALASP